MKKRSLIKWVPPLVMAVMLPKHATATPFVTILCDDLTGSSGSISASSDGFGGGFDTTVTTSVGIEIFSISEVKKGSIKNGITIKGTVISQTGECITRITIAVEAGLTEKATFDLFYGG